MDRRTFLKLGGIGAATALTGVLSNFVGVSRDLPNVLLILVDSLNDWVGVLGGHPNAITPNIDRLAQRGVLFTNAHSPGTISNGARTALFTGMHPTTTGIYGGSADYRDLYPDLTTLPQYFMRLRYQVQGSGPLLHQPDLYSWQVERYVPTDIELVNRQLSGLDFGPNFDWGSIDVSETRMHDYLVAEWASDFIMSTDDPFFLGVGLNSTRPPWYLPRAEYDRFNPSSIELPNDTIGVLPQEARNLIENNYRHQAVLEHNQWAEAVTSYLAAMLFVDDMVGKIIDRLDSSEHSKNTIVILTSPHGLHLGSKKYWLYDTLWESVTHVPLIINVPDENEDREYINAGSTVSRAVSLLDLYPTLMDLFDLKPLHQLDGRSLLPLIQQPELEWDHPVIIARNPNEIAVRSNRWRYIRYAQGGEELYEYIGDRDELINLAANSARNDIKRNLQGYIPTNAREHIPNPTD
jgi:choline-sulfatase